MVRVETHSYEAPTIEDYGDLLSFTLAGQVEGMEDAGTKLSFLDVSGGQFPF